MSPALRPLPGFVRVSSLVAYALLTLCVRVKREHHDFGRRFDNFSVRCFVTIGFWSALFRPFSDGAEPAVGLP